MESAESRCGRGENKAENDRKEEKENTAQALRAQYKASRERSFAVSVLIPFTIPQGLRKGEGNMKSLFERCLRAEYTHTEESGDYAVELDGTTLYIFFQWSKGAEDWRNNFKFLAIPWKPYKHMTHTWLCHRGFLKVWKAIEPHLYDLIRSKDVEEIRVVGYSHGAALALLCYEYIKFNRPGVALSGVGFGCPRVFWGFIPSAVKERFRDFQVVRNGKDIVTHVPPWLFGFRHVAPVVKVGQTNPIKDHTPEQYLDHLDVAQ